MSDFDYFEKVLKATDYYGSYSNKDFITDDFRYYSPFGIKNSLKHISVYLKPTGQISLTICNEATAWQRNVIMSHVFDEDVTVLKSEIKKSREMETGWQLCGNGTYVSVQKTEA